MVGHPQMPNNFNSRPQPVEIVTILLNCNHIAFYPPPPPPPQWDTCFDPIDDQQKGTDQEVSIKGKIQRRVKRRSLRDEIR